MAAQILSQNEIDALLAAVNEGDLDFDAEDDARERAAEAATVAVKYDLLSQDRIIRGRMPTLDIINDRFARQFRITLSNSLRKIVQVNVESTSLMKYGEFLNYLRAFEAIDGLRGQRDAVLARGDLLNLHRLLQAAINACTGNREAADFSLKFSGQAAWTPPRLQHDDHRRDSGLPAGARGRRSVRAPAGGVEVPAGL